VDLVLTEVLVELTVHAVEVGLRHVVQGHDLVVVRPRVDEALAPEAARAVVVRGLELTALADRHLERAALAEARFVEVPLAVLGARAERVDGSEAIPLGHEQRAGERVEHRRDTERLSDGGRLALPLGVVRH
ncbi:MAG: hypothetical protein ACK559_12210, partial [bacterium]